MLPRVYNRGAMHRLYVQLIKPVFFLFDAETIHDTITSFGEILGKFSITRFLTAYFFFYKNKIALRQEIAGISFPNPVGLAAGFDYEAKLIQILPSVGFGFHTVGSVTYGAYEGNPKPRLGRLPKSKSLLVNKGLKSIGAKKIIRKLKDQTFEIPLGISIAKTNSEKTNTDKTGIADYIKTAELFEKSGIGNYYEINISCPNAFGGEPFTTPQKLERLLVQLDKLSLAKPVLVKMPIELTDREADELLKVIVKHKVVGVVFGNLAKDRANPALNKDELKMAGKGNFSGKPTWKQSNRLIAFAYKKYHKKLIVVGCGGVFSAKDAYHKIKLGASLVQLITGMVFEGPQLIGEINKGLVKLLEKDGYENISEAVGTGNK